jgi:hypothetical protein
MKFKKGIFALAFLLTVNANAAEKELKSGQSVVVCGYDSSGGSFGGYSGLGGLNSRLLSDEVIASIGGSGETRVVVRAPYTVSAPSISIRDNGSATRAISNMYCVTVTKQ